MFSGISCFGSCPSFRNLNHGNACEICVSAKSMQINLSNEGNVDRRFSVVTPVRKCLSFVCIAVLLEVSVSDTEDT